MNGPFGQIFAQVLSFVLIPMATTVAGGVLAAYRPPSPRLASVIQHFAAGLVFAAVAAELLPDIIHQNSLGSVVTGFALGVGAMLGVKQVTRTASGPASLLATLGIDVFVDGLVIGIGFVAAPATGLLLTLALALELTFLGLSASAALRPARPARKIWTSTALALLLPVGAAGGVAFGGAPVPVVTAMLSFGLAALLYLVTEELLVEAHELPDTTVATAMFFAGFLLLLVLEEFVG